MIKGALIQSSISCWPDSVKGRKPLWARVGSSRIYDVPKESLQDMAVLRTKEILQICIFCRVLKDPGLGDRRQ